MSSLQWANVERKQAMLERQGKVFHEDQFFWSYDLSIDDETVKHVLVVKQLRNELDKLWSSKLF